MKNEKYLIVNADDYGRTPGVSKGIRKAHRDGIVTSTTALMNMPGIEEALRVAMKEAPDLGLGVHLVLTSGAPLLPPKALDSITGGSGKFPLLNDFIRDLNRVDPEQAAAEWDAQIRKFISVTGRNPDHLDSHHHTTYFSELLFVKFLDLAQRFACPIRIPFPCQSGYCDGLPDALSGPVREFVPRLTRKYKIKKPDWFIGTFYDEQATFEQLLRIIGRIGSGVSELMCHPGYADPALLEGSAYNKPREREIEILTTD
ncbi:MAG: carbohydrate deacetylase, partial [Anaerolineales bacterium]